MSTMTSERKAELAQHKVGNPVCPKCFASHPPLLDCTLQFVANAAPVEGDEAWEADLRGEVMLIVNEAIRDGSIGASYIADRVLAAVKAIVAKAPR